MMNQKSKKDSQIVQALKSWKKQQVSLHDHLCQLLNNLQIDKINGYAHFQRLSQYYKKVKFAHKQGLSSQQIEQKINKQINYPAWLSQQQLLRKLNKIQFESSRRIIQNFQRQSQILFEPVGITFGIKQNCKINSALKMIADKFNAVSLRFWGKILTTSADYYVIQGVCKKNRQPIVSQGMQKYKQGANYYSFWVSQHILNEQWYQLPLITPQQLKISRQIKYIFTGNLNQKVKSYPIFPGQQRQLLKCQLVRITHNCQIAPNGLYSRNQENPDQIDFSQQFKMPEYGDLTNLQNWVHVNPYLLGVGRADYYKDPKLSEQQRQELLAKLQETDPKIQRLKGINEDKPVQKLGLEACWGARQVGNTQVFSGKQQGTTNCYGYVILKNPHWPGWQTVANTKGFGSIYIGYGYKLTQQSFYPISPQDLEAEGAQNDQFDQPNPKNPPDQLQPDSDQQNKKPQDS